MPSNNGSSTKSTPKELVGFFSTDRSSATTTFDGTNPPGKGVHHNERLYHIVSCVYKHTLVALVDNAFSINVCQLKTIKKLALMKRI